MRERFAAAPCSDLLDGSARRDVARHLRLIGAGADPESPDVEIENARPVVDAGESLRGTDRAALAGLQTALRDAREHGDQRPAFTVIVDCLEEFGVELPERRACGASLEQARADWLRRLRSAGRSESTLAAYRVALDDLLAFLARADLLGKPIGEDTIVTYLDDYRVRAQPAPATYYRRFMLLRRFFRWFSRRAGFSDPFLELEPPPKPRQEADWLTPAEFARLLEAAGRPQRNLPGLAERDRLVLLTLVTTGLRRSELLALNWGDLDLDSEHPSLLVRSGKGGRPRRQPLPRALAVELARRRSALSADPDEPVFCGLAGRRLGPTRLAAIIHRSAERADLHKHITAHTLRHSAATWLRQQRGDARLVAAYLGHADLSTVSRYAHVAARELHEAAETIAAQARLEEALRPAGPAAIVEDAA